MSHFSLHTFKFFGVSIHLKGLGELINLFHFVRVDRLISVEDLCKGIGNLELVHVCPMLSYVGTINWVTTLHVRNFLSILIVRLSFLASAQVILYEGRA